jgi:hypothetical protein
MRRRGVPAILAAATLLASCGPGDPDGATLETTVDTVGGIIHVRHTGRAPEWRLEPLVTLGEIGGLAEAASPEEFGRVVRVMADPAGRIYVADALAHEIRVFGPGGDHLSTLGREGAGPGEIAGLHGMVWLAPDTMLVMDYGNARLAQLTTDGEQVGQWPWARLTGRPLLFNGGEGEAHAVVLVPGREGGPRIRSVWGRYRLGEATDTLEIPGAESLGVELPSGYAICEAAGRGISVYSNEFAPALRRVPAPALERAVAISSEYRIAFIDAEGDTTRLITRDAPPVPLPDSAWARVRDEYSEWRNQWRGASCEGSISRPEHLPVVRDLDFDHYGRLLVEYSRADGAAFDVFERDGRWLGTFAAPPRDETVPPYLLDGRLYTVTRDSLGVQRVRVDRLVPAVAVQ